LRSLKARLFGQDLWCAGQKIRHRLVLRSSDAYIKSGVSITAQEAKRA
jgi:hypothetical protein